MSVEDRQQDLSNQVRRGTVLSVEATGHPLVEFDAGGEERRRCLVLEMGLATFTLAAGDVVVALFPTDAELPPIVLGRLPTPVPDVDQTGPQTKPIPPHRLLIEASDELMLKVGDGSITIRKDGKILIKGTDLVSSAKRRNRIKGGAVSIN